MKYFLTFIMLLTPVFSFAGTVINPIVINEDLQHFECTGNESWFEVVDQLPPDTCGSSFSLPNAGTYQVIFYSGSCGDRVFGCSGVNDSGVIESQKTFNVYENSTQYNATWGSSSGFWGDTTISDVSNAMEASVQSTGENIYPLLTFVGIPLAFLLAGLLIYLINKQLTTPQLKLSMSENESNKEDFIYHSAEDLEFKRNFGQETQKRKRGRPRKVV